MPLYSIEVSLHRIGFLYLYQIAHSERRWIRSAEARIWPRMSDLRGEARQHDVGRVFHFCDRIAMYVGADLTDFVRKNELLREEG